MVGTDDESGSFELKRPFREFRASWSIILCSSECSMTFCIFQALLDDFLGHSSILISLRSFLDESAHKLNASSKERLSEKLDSLVEDWDNLGDDISRKEKEINKLLKLSTAVTTQLTSSRELLQLQKDLLNEINTGDITDLKDFESRQTKLDVSISQLNSVNPLIRCNRRQGTC